MRTIVLFMIAHYYVNANQIKLFYWRFSLWHYLPRCIYHLLPLSHSLTLRYAAMSECLLESYRMLDIKSEIKIYFFVKNWIKPRNDHSVKILTLYIVFLAHHFFFFFMLLKSISDCNLKFCLFLLMLLLHCVYAEFYECAPQPWMLTIKFDRTAYG